MKLGIHLPQYGPAAGRDSVISGARLAEQLGFAGVWVSDHLVHPSHQPYPTPYLLDPLVTMSVAAAVTGSIDIGSSVLVAPHHNGVELANALASLDRVSGGRLIVGMGAGWSRDEYAALGKSFDDRGRRLDEIIDLCRACWVDDPVEFAGEFHQLSNIRVLPKPQRPIPIWVGGRTPRARQRAVVKADGFHMIGLGPDEASAIVSEVRNSRPAADFSISIRRNWYALEGDRQRIIDEFRAYEECGIDYVVCMAWPPDHEEVWRQATERLASLLIG